jgi:hypothetical protein
VELKALEELMVEVEEEQTALLTEVAQATAQVTQASLTTQAWWVKSAKPSWTGLL